MDELSKEELEVARNAIAHMAQAMAALNNLGLEDKGEAVGELYADLADEFEEVTGEKEVIFSL